MTMTACGNMAPHWAEEGHAGRSAVRSTSLAAILCDRRGVFAAKLAALLETQAVQRFQRRLHDAFSASCAVSVRVAF
jgi:hypothetical protein